MLELSICGGPWHHPHIGTLVILFIYFKLSHMDLKSFPDLKVVSFGNILTQLYEVIGFAHNYLLLV